MSDDHDYPATCEHCDKPLKLEDASDESDEDSVRCSSCGARNYRCSRCGHCFIEDDFNPAVSSCEGCWGALLENNP